MSLVLSKIEEKAKGTAQERRAFVEGAGYVIERIQDYAVELFLTGDHYSEVPAERLRDLANNLYLELAKVVTEAQKLEQQAAEDKQAEMALMLAHPPEKTACILCGLPPEHLPSCPYHKRNEVKVIDTRTKPET